MEDILTEMPPPSRFFMEDLNNFTPPPSSLPLPFLLFSNPNPKKPVSPSLLIVALSSPSQYFCHHLSSKTLIGTLILPEIPFSGNSLEPSLKDKSCNIYALNDAENPIIFVSVQFSVSAERAHAVAKLLIGEEINPSRVLILESVQSRNYRGKLSPDDTFALKMETSAERGNSSLLKELSFFPSGSVVDGLAAAIMSRCQMKKIKGTLCVSWPDFGGPVISLIKKLLVDDVLSGLKLSIDRKFEDECLKFSRSKDHFLDSELYS